MTRLQLIKLCKTQMNSVLRKRLLLSPQNVCPCKFILCDWFSSESASKLNASDEVENFKEQKEIFRKKVIYHSFYKYEDFILQKKKEYIATLTKQKKHDKAFLRPVALKYFLEEECDVLNKEQSKDIVCEIEDESSVVLPYEVSTIDVQETDDGLVNQDTDENTMKEKSSTTFVEDDKRTVSRKWMKDYDCYEEDSGGYDGSSDSQYGTSDPTVSMSKVPCGGCGALLHCQDPGIPGYLPSEIFKLCSVRELRGITCQRCHFMNHYNTALSVSVDAKQYPRLLSRIKYEMSLVILLVDITDFPCSIWPGILDIIGPKRPLFVIGNKVDLLVGDRKGWIRRARESLRAALPKHANIKYLSLISAKTGFGVEELINKLHSIWEYKGDVYLVGCTNVGKSTLFNTLLKSDYCNVEASDLLQRATTAPWPGTTLNLLKFPIFRPSGISLFLRTQRLQKDRELQKQENELFKLQISKNTIQPVQLVGHIGRTFTKANEANDAPDTFKMNKTTLSKLPQSGLNPFLDAYNDSKWFYDTPGVVNSDQIIDLLTTEELMKTVPKSPIMDRVFIFRQDWTLFIAGLGRMDFVKLSESDVSNADFIKIAVFCPDTLPVTICETSKADVLYDEYVGTDMFVVPSGEPDRLKIWPSLKSVDDIVLQGKGENESCGDIVLSNAGWISVAAGKGQLCKLRCWTPHGRGIHVRQQPLLPFAVAVHGRRMRQTPAYTRRYLKEAATDELRN